ncbi:hypothetical protein [Acinetobacter puyangensis]|uniref:hypothetical protein n=1 Tax=Acinetobacter puyangensis TaxID=1096779 RepID=UPI003A4D8B6F
MTYIVCIMIVLAIMYFGWLKSSRRQQRKARLPRLRQQSVRDREHQSVQDAKRQSFQDIVSSSPYINTLEQSDSNTRHSGEGGAFGGSGASSSWDSTSFSDSSGSDGGGDGGDGGGSSD